MLDRVYRGMEDIYPQMVEWRRDFHRHPELSFMEERTPRMVADFLRGLGLDVRTGVGGRGVVGLLHGGRPGPTVALRADMDALPINDEKDVPYKSTVKGVMHACGHDGHTATLMGVAHVLASLRNELAGNVVFIFQHAEEQTPGGAASMVKDGALDSVDVIFGVHLWTPYPTGVFAWTDGPMMAAADEFIIKVYGKGGHGATPHVCSDALLIGTQIVNQLQTIVSRNVDPNRQAVVTVGTFSAGSSFNIIADTCSMTGTVRTFDAKIREMIIERMESIVKHCCMMNQATYTFNYLKGYPPVINHEQEAVFLAGVAGELFDQVVKMEPIMAGEDFSYYLENVPGSFCFVGAGNPDVGAVYPHHHPKFTFDEQAMLLSGKLLAAAVVNYAGKK